MFACIYIPDFPVESLVRADATLRHCPVAVLEGKPPLVRVVSLNDKARLLGMELGMTKMQAAAFAYEETESTASPPAAKKTPGNQPHFAHIQVTAQPMLNRIISGAAVLRPRSPEQERSAHAALLDVAHAFTPRVEDTAADTLLLDLEGLERLYGPAQIMARELALRVSPVAMDSNIAVASNPDAALHAARGFSGVTFIPSGQEAQRLAVLPIQVLLESDALQPTIKAGAAAEQEREKLRAQTLNTLERWGVRDFRTLTLLPEHALASRLGQLGTRLHSMAMGAGTRTLALCEPAMQFEEAMELESAVETLEPLSFVLNRLLEQLCLRLEARALSAQELTIRLQLEPRVADEATTTMQELRGIRTAPGVGATTDCNNFQRVLRLPVAMRDAKVFLKLLQLELSAHPPGAPITKVWITAKPARPRYAQRGLFLPTAPEAEKLEVTLARIKAIVGERRAGIAKLLDTHRDDAFRMEPFMASEENKSGKNIQETSPKHPLLALRIFRPARQLRVQMANESPATIAPLQRGSDGDELQGEILWAAGPWRSSGDWWNESGHTEATHEDEAHVWDREEWDIALEVESGVVLYRIYRDLSSGEWFAAASYD